VLVLARWSVPWDTLLELVNLAVARSDSGLLKAEWSEPLTKKKAKENELAANPGGELAPWDAVGGVHRVRPPRGRAIRFRYFFFFLGCLESFRGACFCRKRHFRLFSGNLVEIAAVITCKPNETREIMDEGSVRLQGEQVLLAQLPKDPIDVDRTETKGIILRERALEFCLGRQAYKLTGAEVTRAGNGQPARSHSCGQSLRDAR